eukprot:11477442-Ditylum_brightwellii.AAC.1
MALSCSSPIAANGAVLEGCASAAVRSFAAFVAAPAGDTCGILVVAVCQSTFLATRSPLVL